MDADLSARLVSLLRAAGPDGLRQPDRLSCGAASVVVARLLLADPDSAAGVADWRSEVLTTHRSLTGLRDHRGATQLPWPRALGTPPWAVARALGALTGRSHRTRFVLDRDAAYRRLLAAPMPAALYVGNRWLPRHVVLVVAVDPERVTCYEPSRGVATVVPRAAFDDARLRLAGWDVPWFTVTG
ncbi:hypothetical protein [Nocardioides nanhaiensis]|uniref:Peptidase C39-like domain-containing protein n=1 Tax=Nocardioides nanhaiensis TaxID=1476871 RepID=A0ABP8W0S5_9ACTN